MARALTIAICLTLCVVFGSGCMGQSAEDIKIAEAEYGLANDAFTRGAYREALDHVEKAIDHHEHNADAAYLGAMIYLVFCATDANSPDCRYEEAERLVRQALKADPDMRDATNALGVILVHRGEPSEAIAVLEPLSKDILYRSPEKAWGNLGWALLEAGLAERAVLALKRAVAAQPLFCVGHYRLGLAYEKQGDYSAARLAFGRALAIEEGACQRLQAAYWGRARVEIRLGLALEAKADLEKCRELGGVTEVGKKCATKLQIAR